MSASKKLKDENFDYRSGLDVDSWAALVAIVEAAEAVNKDMEDDGTELDAAMFAYRLLAVDRALTALEEAL